MKIVLPMAGFGSRLRPLTWSRPKPLIPLAGRPMIDYVLDMFVDIPSVDEVIFIIGYLGDQIEAYIDQSYPKMKTRYVVQDEMIGQSHAIWLAREGLQGPMIMAFVDTLIESDFSGLPSEQAEAVAWVRRVPDPRRFGVAEVGSDGWVRQLIEKPKDTSNDLAVIGFYYFQSSEALLDAIEEQMARDIQLKGEYFLVDAINIMLERGLRMRVEPIKIWHDSGTPEAVLDANRYVLETIRSNSEEAAAREGVEIHPPVYVDPSAEVRQSVIGPHASIGADCVIEGSVIKDSIIDVGSQIIDSDLSTSLIGRHVRVLGCDLPLNLGDYSVVGIPPSP
jgi:glucose-1-phosphate thymidylyltransferase